MSKVTMAEVAKVAGVSLQTVSRVINKSPMVSSKTRETVEATIIRLGYRPNQVARMLAKDTRSVGILSNNLTLFGPVQLVRAAELTARKRGYFVALSTLSTTKESSQNSLDQFLNQALDALILIDLKDDIGFSTAKNAGARHIIKSPFAPPHSTAWDSDYAGAKLATQHLIDLGHREIAHVAGPQSWPSARVRERAWRDTLITAGLPPGPVLHTNWTPAGGFKAGVYLRDHKEVTGIVAANDDSALGLISAYQSHGLSVPDDISIVGHDNTPTSEFFSPALTTIHSDFYARGARYVDALDVAFGKVPESFTEFEPQIVIRASTSTPRAARNG